MADDQAVHLGDRGFDEAERLGEILRKLLVGAFENGLGVVGGIVRRRRRRRCGAAERRDPLEDVAAQLLELAGEAHDVHQRRAQIVADDIGKALDLVIGFAQIGGALVDGGFEIEIVVAQLRFGVVARARGAAHQEDRDAGQRDHQARPGDGHAGGQHLAAVGIGGAQREQPLLPRRAWLPASSRMVALVAPAAGLAHHRGARSAAGLA